MRLQIDPELHRRLVEWARWCRGPDSEWAARFRVLCRSAESAHLPPAGVVYEGAEVLLRPAMPIKDVDAGEVEVCVMRLPERPRSALRLHYVARKHEFTLARKCRLLGTTHEGYFELVTAAAGQLRIGGAR
jgi:hypothetical protein